jgi:4'-phosphopantetheinyl transferase EntD
MPSASSTQSALEQLFPKCVAVYYSDKKPRAAQLLPEELAGTEKMVKLRLDEFTHGRHCARAALHKLGLPTTAIPRSTDRQPLWPQGTVGSISHSGAVAAAAVSHSGRLLGLGLDIETEQPMDAELIHMICRPDEHIGSNYQQAKLVFSIKEAIYKCIYPLVGSYIDFQQVKVNFEEKQQCFTASADTDACDPDLMSRLKGRYRSSDGFILSSAWLE